MYFTTIQIDSKKGLQLQVTKLPPGSLKHYYIPIWVVKISFSPLPPYIDKQLNMALWIKHGIQINNLKIHYDQ